MTRVYDVYMHQTKPTVGVCPYGEKVHIVQILADGQVKESFVDPIRLGAEIAGRIRSGYRKMPKSKYLLVREVNAIKQGTFTDRHPDLFVSDQKELVLFAAKPLSGLPDNILDSWDALLTKVSGVSGSAQDWIQQQRLAVNYLTADDTHPAFALVVGDWAIAHSQVLMPSKPEVPTQTPSSAPHDWKHFLSQWFDEKSIQKTLEELSWSMRDALVKTRPAIPETELQEDSWIDQASSSAF